MRIAISTDGDFVSAHFGRCPSFTLVDIEGNKMVKKEEVQNPGHEPGAIPEFLHGQGVNCIVAGGMGMRAETFFSQYGIQTVVGISGKVDDIIKQFEQGIVKGGESLCKPGAGKGYGLDKQECDHPDEKDC
jgi:predicted Fe-Mo cluster-binding NifX family protein